MRPLFFRFFIMIILLIVTSLPCSGSENSATDQKNTDSLTEQIGLAIKTAETDLDLFKQNLKMEESAYQNMLEQKKVNQSRIDSLKNLLIVPDINLSVLKKSVEDLAVYLSLVNSNIDKLNEKRAGNQKLLGSVDEKYAIVTERLNDLKKSSETGKDSTADFKTYQSILIKQKNTLTALDKIFQKQLDFNQDLQSSFNKLSEALTHKIKTQKGGMLLQREQMSADFFSVDRWEKEIINFVETLQNRMTAKEIQRKGQLFKTHISSSTIIITVSLIILFFLSLKLFRFVKKKERYQEITQKRAGYPLIIFENAFGPLLFLGAAEILLKTEMHIIVPELLNFIRGFLLVFLFTRILSDAVTIIFNESKIFFFKKLFHWRSNAIYGIRIYAGIYLFIYWYISPQSMILPVLRIVSEILLTAGIFMFWRRYEEIKGETRTSVEKGINWGIKAFAVTGLFFELAGYRNFTTWWYLSWGLSIVVGCLCVILYYSMKDVDKDFIDKFEPESRKSFGISYPLYWMLSNAVYFFIAAFAVTGIAFAWGAGEQFFKIAALVFTRELSLGNIVLSLSGIVFALVIILLTYMFVYFWKKLMNTRILKGSGLSPGARDSIITISVYLVWTGGILISLSVLGLTSTSMAFAFGALGIGLGFGLQNIFNNFISGLILLFERPIQVGDVVEVGGKWGEVKKINVRSTLVQTYTHSSLIIPNSEFISAQVTNWSHRDQNVRRDIDVGVAYGSDTKKVKELMLKAADKVKGVRHFPYKPTVYFINFGESSLDFRLRFWSTLDDFVPTESDIRFEIDNLFRENKIEIPFPQRDIHHKSGYFQTDTIKEPVESPDSSDATGEES